MQEKEQFLVWPVGRHHTLNRALRDVPNMARNPNNSCLQRSDPRIPRGIIIPGKLHYNYAIHVL